MSNKKNYVIVNNKSYGYSLKGIKIYFEGKKPKSLSKDGKINFGKHILEILRNRFRGEKFQWIITEETDSITIERKIYRVRTSQKTLKRINSELWDRTRDIKNDIVSNAFSIIYPSFFGEEGVSTYVPGILSGLLGQNILSKLSSEDKDAINKFLPDYISSESISAVNLLKAKTQIKTLKELATNLEKEINGSYSEAHWQKYIKSNILIIQQGYISVVEKMNIAVGNTKFPDFSIVTHDGYIDILEIKKPTTQLLREDFSRSNFFWDSEISKAIIQVENYIENITNQAAAVRSYILDNLKIDLKILRPRGIILAGRTKDFNSQKEKDDFRMLSSSLKNITFVTYDELLDRLENYIRVLEEYSN